MVLSDWSFSSHERKVFMKYARVLTASVILFGSALAADAHVSAPPIAPLELVAANAAAGEHAGKAASTGDLIGKGGHKTKRALRRFARKLRRMTDQSQQEEDPRHAPEVP